MSPAARAILPVCLLLPLAISPWGFDDAIYLKESLLLLAGGVLLLAEAGAVWRGGSGKAALPIPLVLFLALALASVFQVTNAWLFAFRLALLLAGVAVFVAVARSAAGSGPAASYIRALCVSAAVATGYGVIQRAGLDPFLAPDSRFVATFGNPHLYAEYIAPLLPAALCLALVGRGPWPTAAAAAGLGLLFAGLLWARARGPALAALAGMAFLGWALRRLAPDIRPERRRRLWVCGCILVGVAALMALTGHVVVRKPAGAPPAPHASRPPAAAPARPAQEGDVGAGFRLAVYQDTLSMIRSRPLTGFGLGNFRIAYPPHAKIFANTFTEVNPVGHVHSDVLEVAAEMGLLGAAVLVWMLLTFVRASFTGTEGAPLAEAWPGLAAGAGLVGLGISSLFAFGFYDPATSLELWVFAGIAAAPAWIASSSAPRDVPRWIGEGRARYPAAAVLGCLGLGVAWLGISSEIADVSLMQGLARYYTGRYAEAVAPLERAARLEVGRTEAMVMLAQAYLEVGTPNRALAVVNRAQDLEPHNAKLHYLRGTTLGRLGRLEEARRAQQEALALYPLYSLPHVALGELAERRGDDAQARAEYETALRVNPGRAEARDGLGLLAVKAGNLEDAIRLWEEGARLDPGDAITAHNLAVAYGRKGDGKRAAAWQARAAALRAAAR